MKKSSPPTNPTIIHPIQFGPEYLQGQSLARLVGSQALPAKQAAQYVRTIAEAVHYAHERGLLHRDLKPANVLVDKQNQVRVMDFGLARRLEGDSELTLTGQVLGSPHYMPPEQAAGKRGRVSRRTDVYGLGAVLYHLLTGRPPFLGEELADTLQEVLNREPVPPRLLYPAVPRDLETICLKCLEKEPARRYPTAKAVADELGRFLQDQPIEARPVGRLAKSWRWCRRQPVRAGLIAGLLTVFLLGTLGVLWEWQRAERQRQRAEAGELSALRMAYVSDMNLAFQAVEADNRGRALELLNRYWPDGKSKARSPKSRAQSPKSEVPGPISEADSQAAVAALATHNSQPSTDLRGWEWRHLMKRCESDASHTLARYYYEVSALAVSSNGRWLAVSSCTNLVIWDLLTRQPHERVPITAVMAVVDFSADGRLLACAEADMTELAKNFNAVIFDTVTHTIRARFPHPGAWWLAKVALSPDARVLATLDWEGEKGFVKLWDIQRKECLRSIVVPKGNSMIWGKLRFSPDGQVLAIGQTDGHLQLLDWATGKTLQDIAPPEGNGAVAALVFAPDGKELLTGYAPLKPGGVVTNVCLWNTQTGQADGRFIGHPAMVTALAFLADGRTVASASEDATIRLWDLPTQKETRRLSGHAGQVSALVALPEGKTLISGGKDGCVCLWSTESHTNEIITGSLTGDTRDFAFLPDSRRVARVNRAGQIEVWDTASLELVSPLRSLGTNNLCLAPIARAKRLLLAAGTDGGRVNIWDLASVAEPRLETSFQAHRARVAVLKFDPRGQVLLSSAFAAGAWADSEPGNFKAWDISSWRERPGFRVGSHQAACLPEANLMAVRGGPVGVNFIVRNLFTKQERMIPTGHKTHLTP